MENSFAEQLKSINAPTPTRKIISFAVEKKEHEEIKQTAKYYGMNVSQYFRNLHKFAFKNK